MACVVGSPLSPIWRSVLFGFDSTLFLLLDRLRRIKKAPPAHTIISTTTNTTTMILVSVSVSPVSTSAGGGGGADEVVVEISVVVDIVVVVDISFFFDLCQIEIVLLLKK